MTGVVVNDAADGCRCPTERPSLSTAGICSPSDLGKCGRVARQRCGLARLRRIGWPAPLGARQQRGRDPAGDNQRPEQLLASRPQPRAPQKDEPNQPSHAERRRTSDDYAVRRRIARATGSQVAGGRCSWPIPSRIGSLASGISAASARPCAGGTSGPASRGRGALGRRSRRGARATARRDRPRTACWRWRGCRSHDRRRAPSAHAR